MWAPIVHETSSLGSLVPSNACSWALRLVRTPVRAGGDLSVSDVVGPGRAEADLRQGRLRGLQFGVGYGASGGGWAGASMVSAQVPVRRRARCSLGLSTTWAFSSRPCLAR